MSSLRPLSGNPFLAWLDGAAPPLAFRAPAFRAALVVAGREAFRSMRQLERQPSWDALLAWLCKSQKLMALRTLADVVARPRTKAVEACSRRAKAWMDAMDRREARFSKGTMRRHVALWRKDPARTANERDLLDYLMTSWTQAHAYPRELHSERMVALMERRENKRVAPAVRLAEDDVTELPRDVQRVARAQARRVRRGRAAGLLRVGQAGFDEAMANLSSEDTRRRMWRAQQAILPGQKDVRNILEARQQEAGIEGYSSRIEQVMTRHALKSARTVRGALTSFGDGLASTVRQTLNRTESYAQDRWGISTAPWNTAFVDERAPLRASALLPADNEVLFPEEQTSLRIARDVFALRGWRVGRRTRASNGLRHWVLNHRNGRKAHLVLALSATAVSAIHNEDAYSMGIHSAWNHDHGDLPPTFFVTMGRPYTRRGFSWNEVAVLTHEFGHVLHGLGQPTSPLAWERMPSDMAELPSQLVELMAYCPTALARWVSPKARPCYRTASYWRQRMAFQAQSAVMEQTDALKALVDFVAHATGPEFDACATAQALQRRLGLDVFHDEERTAFSLLSWNDYGGSYYTYLFSRILIAQMIPQWKHGAPDEASVIPAVHSLFEHVLEKAVHGGDTAKAWRQWRGETLAHSAKMGAKRLARRVARRAD